jgi:hypothetical protein
MPHLARECWVGSDDSSLVMIISSSISKVEGEGEAEAGADAPPADASPSVAKGVGVPSASLRGRFALGSEVLSSERGRLGEAAIAAGGIGCAADVVMV